MHHRQWLPLLGALLAASLAPAAEAPNSPPEPKPVPAHRLLVLSDIEADPDDTQSFIRLFLYANEIELTGLVATTSTWKRSAVAPDSIRVLIDAYGKAHPRLLQHDARYPKPDALRALVKAGNPAYGMAGVGDGKDSEGSDWIIHVLDQDDPRPLWISIWGGANTLAQALHKLRATRSPAELDRLIAKLRVHAISDQDDSGPWIRREFPALFTIVSPGGNYEASTWIGISTVVDDLDNTTISNAWLAAHIQQDHGPLGAAYPDVAWGIEGDTPSWLSLVPNGLNVPDRPDWGGWSGRYELRQPTDPMTDAKTFVGDQAIPPESRPVWTTAVDSYTPPVAGEFNRATRPGEGFFKDNKVTLWRWRDDFQNDFAARMDWTVYAYADANHPPVPALAHDNAFSVASGESFVLDARRSHDPDGDSLSFYWFTYAEAGSATASAVINGPENAATAWVTAPKVDKSSTVHLILRLTDKGTPALTRYQRIIVTVTP